ncbi:MAG TPA: ABC transporter ATP-binding protein, partial [Acidimicrobiales bacterium]|nr:ABC transporter ATP-binding protein [Acidimicrobiales bacterium]
ATQVAVPAVTKQAIDAAIIERDDALAPYVWLLVGLALARGLLALYYRYGLGKLAYEVEYDLRQLLYRHLTLLSFSFYDRVQSGQIISRANSDIRSVTMLVAFAPLMGMLLLSFAVAFVVMCSIHVWLTLVAVATLPGVYLLGARLRNLVFPLSWVIAARQADVATIVDENVNGVRVVKSFAAEERQIGALARAVERLRWANVSQADARATYAPFMENLPRVGLAAVLAYGGWLAIDGQVTIGTLVAFNAYVVMLQMPFRMLGFFLMMTQRAGASAGRIYEVLDEVPAIQDRPGAVDLVDPVGRIELRGVDFRYGGEDSPLVLDGLDLTVEPGETVALVGRTASGKSTLVRLLPRFYDVDAGAVLVDGHDVRDLTVLSLRAAVGIVTDEPFLFSSSVRDNIAFARPDAGDEEVEAAATAAQAHGFISALSEGYDTVVGERGYTLSGGQRQRIALARIILANPRILILDDATSAVDVHVEEAIHAALTASLEERTTIIVAHRLSSITLADRVVLLDGGRVAATGTHAQLLATEPRYADVVAHLEEEEA